MVRKNESMYYFMMIMKTLLSFLSLKAQGTYSIVQYSIVQYHM